MHPKTEQLIKKVNSLHDFAVVADSIEICRICGLTKTESKSSGGPLFEFYTKERKRLSLSDASCWLSCLEPETIEETPVAIEKTSVEEPTSKKYLVTLRKSIYGTITLDGEDEDSVREEIEDHTWNTYTLKGHEYSALSLNEEVDWENSYRIDVSYVRDASTLKQGPHPMVSG